MPEPVVRDVPFSELVVHALGERGPLESFRERYADDPILKSPAYRDIGWPLTVRDTWVDTEAVEWYMQVLDSMPPIVAYDIGDFLVVSEGVHRYAAAQRLGRETIKTEVRQGTLTDALIHSATANLGLGLHLSLHERNKAMARLRALGWSLRMIGAEFGDLSEATVSKAIRAVETEAALEHAQATSTIFDPHYPQEDLAIVSQLEDVDVASRLLAAKKGSGWDRSKLRAAVEQVSGMEDGEAQAFLDDLPEGPCDRLTDSLDKLSRAWIPFRLGVPGVGAAYSLCVVERLSVGEVADRLVQPPYYVEQCWLGYASNMLARIKEDLPVFQAVVEAVRERLDAKEDSDD